MQMVEIDDGQQYQDKQLQLRIKLNYEWNIQVFIWYSICLTQLAYEELDTYFCWMGGQPWFNF